MTSSESYRQISKRIVDELANLAYAQPAFDQRDDAAREFALQVLANLVRSDTAGFDEESSEVITITHDGLSARSRKLTNVTANIHEFLAAVAEGSISIPGAAAISPSLAVVALVLVLSRLISSEIIRFDPKMTAIVWTLWESGHLNPERALISNDLLIRVNSRLDQQGLRISKDEFDSALELLSKLGCTRSRCLVFDDPSSRAWWLQESVEYSFQS